MLFFVATNTRNEPAFDVSKLDVSWYSHRRCLICSWTTTIANRLEGWETRMNRITVGRGRMEAKGRGRINGSVRKWESERKPALFLMGNENLDYGSCWRKWKVFGFILLFSRVLRPSTPLSTLFALSALSTLYKQSSRPHLVIRNFE